MDGVIPGSGRLSVTTWVYGLAPGEWTVTAELVRNRMARPVSAAAGGRAAATTLPRASWSWRRWALGTGPFTAVSTRWAPIVRLTRIPAVVPGSWPALITLGILAGVLAQAALLARAHVGVEHALVVDGFALLAGLLGAKLWYVFLKPRLWRRRLAEGWSVDGLLVMAPLAGLATVSAHELEIGAFLDASTPALFLGIAIGRVGCFLTGCCAGRFTRAGWGVWSSDRRIGARRIPTQLIESGAALVIGAAALALATAVLWIEGAAFLGAIAAYVLIRQRLLRLRAEPRGFSVAAALTAGLAALVLVGDVLLVVATA